MNTPRMVEIGPTRTAALIAIVVAACVISCGPSLPRGSAPADEVPTATPMPGSNPCWPLDPLRVEDLLAHRELEVRERKGAGGGVTGASRLTLYFPEQDVELKVKWKEVPSDLDSWNNSPRKELAAYAVQKLFLDPRDYVVPPTVIRCLRPGVLEDAEPNVEGADCVLGVFALWIDNVEIPDELMSPSRFARDANYAYHISNLNILTFLIDHRDGRSNNFLAATDPKDRRVFSIDNGVSFGPWIYNYFVPNWNEMRVPAVSREAVERLRQVTDEDLERLAIGVELRLGKDGILRVTEGERNLDPDEEVRREGDVIQLGLEDDELEDLQERLSDLLEAVEDGRLAIIGS